MPNVALALSDRQRQFAENVASYLANAPLSELVELVSALAGECSHRGIQVAAPLGVVAARIEYVAGRRVR